jgi:hypothetical protein
MDSSERALVRDRRAQSNLVPTSVNRLSGPNRGSITPTADDLEDEIFAEDRVRGSAGGAEARGTSARTFDM